MPPASIWLRSLMIAGAVVLTWAAAPQAQAQSTSCTLRTSIDIYSKPKTQGRRIRLSAGTVLEILGHSGGWYTVYTGTAEAYVPASAYKSACTSPPRAAPRGRPAPDLVDIPLEPLPGAPTLPSNPPPLLPQLPELKDSPGTQAAPPPAPPPTTPEVTRPATPPKHLDTPKRLETPPPASYFEPPPPALELRLAPREFWSEVETGLWIGGGVTAGVSVALFITNAILVHQWAPDISNYKMHLATYNANPTESQKPVITTEYDDVVSKQQTVGVMNALSITTAVVGGAALAGALGLHFWGPQAQPGDAPEANPVSMVPRLHIGLGSFVVEGRF